MIRDFIDLELVAKQFLELAFNENASGIYNCGSGEPQSIKDFASKIVKSEKSNIKLKFGSHNNRKHEPNIYWANMNKYKNLLKEHPSKRPYK